MSSSHHLRCYSAESKEKKKQTMITFSQESSTSGCLVLHKCLIMCEPKIQNPRLPLPWFFIAAGNAFLRTEVQSARTSHFTTLFTLCRSQIQRFTTPTVRLLRLHFLCCVFKILPLLAKTCGVQFRSEGTRPFSVVLIGKGVKGKHAAAGLRWNVPF